jgi:hypothetical protein
MMATSTSSTSSVITESMQRLLQVRDLWTRSQKDQLEIGRLLYEERKERLSVGGRGIHEGFHEWLREASIPKASAYRRIAEYEISIGERVEPESPKKPVSSETSFVRVKPIATITPKMLTAKLGDIAIIVGHDRKTYQSPITSITGGRCHSEYRIVAGSKSENKNHFDDAGRAYSGDGTIVDIVSAASSLSLPPWASCISVIPKIEAAVQPTKPVAAPAIEDAELTALLAPLSESELESDRAFESTLKAPAMETLPEQNESDLARLRRPFASLGLDLKKSNHGSKYVLDKLTESQLDKILAALVRQ